MAIWPTNNQELFPISYFLLATASMSIQSGIFLILTLIFDSTQAIFATVGFLSYSRWALNLMSIDKPLTTFSFIHEAMFLASFSRLYEHHRRVGLLSFLGSNLFSFVIFSYIPLMLNFYFGDLRYQDLYLAHFYLIANLVFMRIVWVYLPVGENGRASPPWVGFIGFVLLLNSWLFLKEFEVMELERIHRGVTADAKGYLNFIREQVK